MTSDAQKNQLLSKHRKLIGLEDTADMSELKNRYSALHERFNQQLRSEDPAQTKKGQSNLVLLDQAYNLLAQDIRDRQIKSHQQATAEALSGGSRLSIELDTIRVGFQILEGGEFFALETKRVDVNVMGMRSVKTNNRVSASWPSGKLTIFNDHFKLKCIFGSFDFPYNDIVSVTKVWYVPFSLCMKQKSDESMRINIFGLGLGKKLKELAPQFTTKLRIDY
jgi:hypothetical protein